MKHIKKGKKKLCAICGKGFSHTTSIKNHYARFHTKEELAKKSIPQEPIVAFHRQIAKKKTKVGAFMAELEEERRDAFLLLKDNIRVIVLEKQYRLPILKLVAYEGALQSNITPVRDGITQMHYREKEAYKVHYFADMELDTAYVSRIGLEYQILKLAAKHQSLHLSPLHNAYLGRDHVAFKVPKYEISLAQWLRKSRDTRHYLKIFLQVIAGLRELHDMGFVHRDLRPSNIMLCTRPYKVTLINFEYATPRSQSTRGTNIGKEGYAPHNCQLKDGDTLWDVYALTAIILEADMYPGEYQAMAKERGL